MTTHLARTYALIGLEDLNAKGMLSNHHLAQVVSDASFFEVKRQLFYKTEQYGGRVQLVDRWYPSSKTCSGCGYVKPALALSERMFVCENCGLTLDRDFNASLTIKKEASRLGAEVAGVASSSPKFACGAGRSGVLCGEHETTRVEAGTTRW